MSKVKDILSADKAQCCGCGTCALVCPTGAITMEQRELGCLYPKIDSEKCMDCLLCRRSCAYQTEKEEKNQPLSVFAAVAEDQELLKRSASGGVFASIAHSVLEAGGVVFGCSLEMVDGVLTPVHICVERPEGLVKLQGSKYVQSFLGDTAIRIKKMLQQGRMVLFSGTPCQVDAVKHLARDVDQSKLYTIDIICHGVPSAKLFQDYLEQLEKKKITVFSFRDKTFGWGLNACYSFERSENKHVQKLLSPGLSSYYSYFLDAETYRESCYSCRYANMERVGDITIGDFWGFEQEHPDCLVENGGQFHVREGVSSILVNSSKGRILLEQFGDKLKRIHSDAENVKKWNRQLRMPSVPSRTRKEIMAAYESCGYAGVDRLFRKQLGIRYWVRSARSLGRNLKKKQ